VVKISELYVLINCDLEMRNAVMEQLWEIDEVKNVSKAIGQFDIIVKMESEDIARLNHLMVWRIKKMACISNIVALPMRE